MKRVTLNGLNRIAEDHNKHNRGDSWTWEDILFNTQLNGNKIRKDLDHMSKKETLIVLDWAAQYMYDDSLGMTEQIIYRNIYSDAKHSLIERL